MNDFFRSIIVLMATVTVAAVCIWFLSYLEGRPLENVGMRRPSIVKLDP